MNLTAQETLPAGRRSFLIWLDCLNALIFRETQRKFSTNTGGIFAAVEPLGFIAVITLTRLAFDATPIFGDSVLLYYCTGVLPHYAVIWISAHTKPTDLTVVSFPRVQPLDQLVAKGIVEMLYFIAFMIFTFTILWLSGVSAFSAPQYPLRALMVVETLFGLGLGIGIINSVVASFFPLWIHIYHVVGRGAMILSGVVFVPDFISPHVRYWLSWNPILHGVSWFRTSFYETYPTHILDREFLVECTILALVIGLAFERATRRKRAML